MTAGTLLRVSGEVETPRQFTFADLASLDEVYQIADVTRHGAKRPGAAILLRGILQAVGLKSSGKFLGLHSDSDDFHASIPLGPVKEKAFLIYRLNDQPLPHAAGGPLRFFVPDHASCHAAEIDECANVKFAEHFEITAARGFDNRPQDDDEHERLHSGQ